MPRSKVDEQLAEIALATGVVINGPAAEVFIHMRAPLAGIRIEISAEEAEAFAREILCAAQDARHVARPS